MCGTSRVSGPLIMNSNAVLNIIVAGRISSFDVFYQYKLLIKEYLVHVTGFSGGRRAHNEWWDTVFDYSQLIMISDLHRPY